MPLIFVSHQCDNSILSSSVIQGSGAQPAPAHRKRGRPSKSSADDDTVNPTTMHEQETLPSLSDDNTQASQQVLKRVVIPASSRSSLGSSLSSIRDQSSEYDTPATSVAVTPAEPILKEGSSIMGYSKLGSGSMRFNVSGNRAKGKRKRSYEEEITETDALLAQRLQAEEYDDLLPARSNIKRGRRKRIEDSEEEEPFSSSLADAAPAKRMGKLQNNKVSVQTPVQFRSDSEEDGGASNRDLLAAEMPDNKKPKATHRLSLPSRASRDNARRSLKDKNTRRVIDSEDSGLSEDASDVSLFASELDSEALLESGDSDDEPEDDIQAPNDQSVSAALAAPLASAIRRRRAAPALGAPNRVRGRRRGRPFEDRVSFDLCLAGSFPLTLTCTGG